MTGAVVEAQWLRLAPTHTVLLFVRYDDLKEEEKL